MTAVDIARLPRRKLGAGKALYRIHLARFGPWFFASSAGGRFNPTGSPGRGTCYWAESSLGAWVEHFRTIMTWASSDIALRVLSTITLDEELIVCDLTVKRALAAGVTTAITGGADYEEPQALADQLQALAGGIRYRVRHDLSAKLIAVGWFGDAGPAADRALASLPEPSTTAIPDDLVEAATKQFRYRVLPAPPP